MVRIENDVRAKKEHRNTYEKYIKYLQTSLKKYLPSHHRVLINDTVHELFLVYLNNLIQKL